MVFHMSLSVPTREREMNLIQVGIKEYKECMVYNFLKILVHFLLMETLNFVIFYVFAFIR